MHLQVPNTYLTTLQCVFTQILPSCMPTWPRKPQLGALQHGAAPAGYPQERPDRCASLLAPVPAASAAAGAGSGVSVPPGSPPPALFLGSCGAAPPGSPVLLVLPSPGGAPACSAPVCSVGRYEVIPAGSRNVCQPAGAPRLIPPPLSLRCSHCPRGLCSPAAPALRSEAGACGAASCAHPNLGAGAAAPGVGCGCLGLGKPPDPRASGGVPMEQRAPGPPEGGAGSCVRGGRAQGSHGRFQAPSMDVALRQGPRPLRSLPWRRPRGRILPPRGGSRAGAISPVYESTKLSQQAFSIPFICVSPLSSFYFP